MIFDKDKECRIFCTDGKKGYELLECLEKALPELTWKSGVKPTSGPGGRIERLLEKTSSFTIDYEDYGAKGIKRLAVQWNVLHCQPHYLTATDVISSLSGYGYTNPSKECLMEFLKE